MSFCDNSYSTQNSMNASKSKSMFASGRWLLLGFLVLGFGNGVDAVAAGRRRRRSLYNVRPCGPGEKAIWTSSKKKVNSCVSCEKGKYRTDTSHALEECMLCPGGRHSSDDLTYCLGDICKAGSYGLADTTVCKQCPAGKYSGKDGVFACKECESGRFVGVVGANHCQGELCPAGKWGIGGAVSQDGIGVCSPCEAGKYSLAGATSCLACPDGKYSREGATVCIDHDKCPHNSYPDVVPRTDSSKISCKRCIYSSEHYYVAFVFAIVVSGLNMAFFIYKRSILAGVCLSLVPMGWILFMNVCNSRRSDIRWSIISFVMNLICLYPLCSLMKQTCSDKYARYCREQLEKKAVQPAQQLSIMVNGAIAV